MKLAPVSFLLCAFAAASPVVVGCSSSGEDSLPGETPDTGSGSADTGATDRDAGTDASVQDATVADSGTPDAGPRDAGSDALADATVPADAGFDAGSVDAARPDAGRACTSSTDFEERSCGICGSQSRICRTQSDGGLDWAAWSFCNGQRDGGCVPGTEPDGGVACGSRCGRSRAVCQTDCTYAFGSCIPAPTAVCDQGSNVWVQADAGCTDPTLGRRRTCLDDCTWGAWTGCEPYYVLFDGGLVAPAELTITNDTTQSVTKSFAGAPTMGRIPTFPNTCPLTGSFSSAGSYVYTTIGNATAQPRTVAIWASTPTGGATIDTVIAVYPTATGPTDEAGRRNCVGKVNDDCSSGNPQGCVSTWSGLVGTDAVVIPAGATYTILLQPYSGTSSGSFVLNAKAVN